jgi:CRISPR-associated protein Cas5h
MGHILISFDLKGDFGVFKKPDVNDGLQLTYNLLHKPALLGILGAILGMKGYQQFGVFPEYYETLRDIPVGIEPLEGTHDKGNFAKTVIKYTNTVGYANADGGTLIVTEQALLFPAYRCYLLLDQENPTHLRLRNLLIRGEADYLPYFGKNECAAWWEVDSVVEYEAEAFVPTANFTVSSAFIKEESVWNKKVQTPSISFDVSQGDAIIRFAYFERIPKGFYVGDAPQSHESDLFSSSSSDTVKPFKPFGFVQYDLVEVAFTNWVLKKDSFIQNLHRITPRGAAESRIIQLN